jgi:hypothetical protein
MEFAIFQAWAAFFPGVFPGVQFIDLQEKMHSLYKVQLDSGQISAGCRPAHAARLRTIKPRVAM